MLTNPDNEYLQISINDLRNILEAFRRGQVVPKTPLVDLVPRHFRPSWCEFPDESIRSLAKDVALIEWLSVEITKGLARQRRYYGFKRPKRVSSRSKAIQAMNRDFLMGSKELEAWSLLFHLYIRVDLNLKVEELDSITLMDDRTRRRRRQHGLQRLAFQLARNAVYT